MRNFLSFLPVLLLMLLPALVRAEGGPVITEFLAKNSSGILDDEGTHQDWIEIHNPASTAQDLGGYHLTDDLLQPTKWTVPTGFTIAPGGYVVIFASGKDHRLLGAPLHTNFSLTSDGEYLGLYAPSGGVAVAEFAPTFPAQSADVSYGLLQPAAGAASGYFDTPSPGAPNVASASPADAVRFSLSSRTFNQGSSLSVALSTVSTAAVIRYTFNRSAPIANAGHTGDFTADVATDVITMPGHGFSEREEVQVATTGTLPGGLGLSLTYYVSPLGPDTLELSDSPGGQPIDITSVGTGVHSIRSNAAYFTGAVSDLCTTAFHPFMDRDEVQVSSTGNLPVPLLPQTSYYVLWQDRNTYRLTNTLGGPAIDLTTTGDGTMTIRRMPSALYSAPLTVSYSQRIRARAFESGRRDGPIASESYLVLDAAAQAFTSNLPIMILHSWGSGHPDANAPGGTSPEDTKLAAWFIFEPKAEGTSMVARMTNLPDLTTPAYFERRGSSTFGAQKYSMTMGALDEANSGRNVSPLGFAENDDFVLNAPFQYDRSLMHNDLMYRLSNEAGRWAPQTRHVEVFQSVDNDIAAAGGTPAWGLVTGANLGADYYGVYSFQDKIKRGAGLVDVEKITPQDETAPAVQGGYIFKIDRLDNGDSGLNAGGRNFALVQPKEYTSYPSHLPVITTAQKTYLAGILNSMYAACTGPNLMNPTLGYQAYLDVPAALDHHLFSTAAKSADAFRLSGCWHKSRYGKLAMGPVFDFDRAMGSTEPGDTRSRLATTWRCDTSDLGTDFFHNASIYAPNYFHYMFQDPNFWQAWIDRLHQLRQSVLSTAHVHAVIDEYTELLDPGNGPNTPAKRNFAKFTAMPPTSSNTNTPGTDGTFRGEAKWLKNWWGKAGSVTANGRLDFMDGQFMRPAEPNLVDGSVPSGTAVTLTSPSQTSSDVKIYYTTNGTDPRAVATVPYTFPPPTYVDVTTVLSEINPVRATVPTSATTGGATSQWRGADINGNGNNWDDFDDSTWFTNTAGTKSGVGFDDVIGSGQVDFLPYISVRWNTAIFSAGSVNTRNVMRPGTINGITYAGNASCYIRLPFTLSATDAARLVTPNRMMLYMRYDDGFIAYLNGTEVAKATQPATYPSVAFNSTANGAHNDADSIVFQPFDITAFMGSAHIGNNILAIQGLNSAANSADLLIQPKLVIQEGVPNLPELTTNALEYTSAIQIQGPTQIFARTFTAVRPSDPPTVAGGGIGSVPNGSSWSAPTKLYYFPGANSAAPVNLRISEVMYHPLPPTAAEVTTGFTLSNDFEFIRLTNMGNTPLELTGIYFSNGVDFTSGPGLQNWLPAGASVVVVENRNAFISRYGNSFTILGEFGGELDDGGEHIVLNDKTGAVIADFIYGDQAPWPATADAGRSLLYVAGPVADASSWTSSVDPGGSGVTNYSLWAKRYFDSAVPSIPAADQLPTADPDHDGVVNLLEYAFVTDPLASDSIKPDVIPKTIANNGSFAVIRRSGTTDLTMLAQTCGNLIDWLPVADPLSVVDLKNATELVTWPLPSSAGEKHFVRFQVTTP